MIEFIKAKKNLSFSLLLSILFFLRKGIQYSLIGSYAPLLVVVGLIALLAISLQVRKTYFVLVVRVWAIALIIWSLIRIIISIIHLTVRPFDGSFHMSQQLGAYGLILSVLMLAIGVVMFRSSNKKRLKNWL